MDDAELVALVDALAALPYGGEAVDQRGHALQAAGQAIAAGADADAVVAAALHDVGRAPAVRAQYPGLVHEAAGALFVQELFGDRAAWLVAAHVPAKRYLVTVDERYAAGLSPASVRSLELQGGRLRDDDVTAFEAHPWATDAVRLRVWDDAAKVTGADAPDPEDLLRWFAKARR